MCLDQIVCSLQDRLRGYPPSLTATTTIKRTRPQPPATSLLGPHIPAATAPQSPSTRNATDWYSFIYPCADVYEDLDKPDALVTNIVRYFLGNSPALKIQLPSRV
jgi:hypothetical protein